VTCKEFTQFIIDYRSGELESSLRVRFDHHLDACVNCQRYLESYDASIRLGKHAFDDDNAAVPADVPDALIQAILSARRRE
jgi:anti-sigma factor RsiW